MDESPPQATASPTGTVAASPAANSDVGVAAFFDPGALPFVIGVIVGAVVLVRVVNRVLERLAEAAVKRRLVIKQIGTFAGFGIYIVAAVTGALSLFNLSSQALFALSGSLAVMAGFALKDFASSVLASLTILVTRPFQVGDRISFGAYYGEVRDIGLRSVQLVTLDDNLVTIPSNKVLTEAVANANAGALDCMVVIPLYVSARAELGRAKEIVHDAVLASRYLYLGKRFTVLSSLEVIPDVGVAIKLVAKAYVYDARHEKAFASDVTELALGKFRQEGIELPARNSLAPLGTS